jgi:hypothetical protein
MIAARRAVLPKRLSNLPLMVHAILEYDLVTASGPYKVDDQRLQRWVRTTTGEPIVNRKPIAENDGVSL